MSPALPSALADGREAPRVRALNGRPIETDGRYVLCWLRQALRARDNPVIDAAVRLGNAARLPVLVHHSVCEDHPYASDRLHRFILGASIDLATGCRMRGVAFVAHVGRAERREQDLVHRREADAAAIVVEDQPTSVARRQAERVAAHTAVPVYAAMGDPSTYGNIAAMFGGSPDGRKRAVYGRVAARGDGSTRNRTGGAAWLATAAGRPVPAMSVPGTLPRGLYLEDGRPATA